MQINGKNYRRNVAAVIVSSLYPHNCDVFVGQRIGKKNAWQFPQGGIDEGEEPEEALFRELKEEIGTKKVEIIAEYPEWTCYDFPEYVKKENIAQCDGYDGQVQKYYLVKLKNSAKINLNTKHAEFDSYKFIQIEEVLDYIVYFKKGVYSKVLHYFKKEGYL